MQRTEIIGNLTADPVKRSTANGKTVTTFTVAVNEKYGGQDHATFFNCSAWGQIGEPIATYLHKGDKVFTEGRISARHYKTKSGEDRVSLELNVNKCEFLVTSKRGEAYDDDLKVDDGMTVVGNEDLPF